MIGNGVVWMIWNADIDIRMPAAGTLLNFEFSVFTLAMGYGASVWQTQIEPRSGLGAALRRRRCD